MFLLISISFLILFSLISWISSLFPPLLLSLIFSSMYSSLFFIPEIFSFLSSLSLPLTINSSNIFSLSLSLSFFIFWKSITCWNFLFLNFYSIFVKTSSTSFLFELFLPLLLNKLNCSLYSFSEKQNVLKYKENPIWVFHLQYMEYCDLLFDCHPLALLLLTL